MNTDAVSSLTQHRSAFSPAAARRQAGKAASLPILAAAGLAVWLSAPLAHAVNRTWDGGGNGTNWTSGSPAGLNWSPDGVPTTADNLTLDNSIVTIPVNMDLTNNLGALTITFANGFNGTNTTTIGSSSTLTRTLTLGSAGNPWTISNNATSGTVTFQPTNLGGTVAMVITLASNGTMSVAGGATLAVTTSIGNTGGNFGITKIGLGTLTLGGANTYAGGTAINAGSLNATTNGALGSGNVTDLGGTFLTLAAGVTNAIADTATLTLGGTGAGAAKLTLSATTGTLQETVGALILGTTPQAPGTYGATGSGAANIDDNYFAGAGILTVVPEPSSWIPAAVGGLGLLVMFRRRSQRQGRA